ncbi:MAG: hypothetical protein R3348_07385, partial [Xanthomonadales bacterium]|nr:hypothetical protein [Xanthomonadales bacterium]
AGPTGRAEIYDPHLFQDVRPDSAFIPLYVAGEVSGFDVHERPVPIAIAVNDTIVATTQTFRSDAIANRFEALLPEPSLRPGANKIQLFQILSGPAGHQLAALTTTPTNQYSLQADGDLEYIQHGQADRYPVHEDATAGRVGSLLLHERQLFRIEGALAEEPGPDARIVALIGADRAASAPPRDQDFRIGLGGIEFNPDQPPQVRIFLVDEDKAIEFRYPPACSRFWHFAPPPHWQGIECERATETPLRLQEGTWQGSLDFRDTGVSQYLVGGGWSVHEGLFSWTARTEALVELPLPEGVTGLVMSASVTPFLAPPAVSRQTVIVVANNVPVASFELTSDEPHRLNWSVPPGVVEQSPERLLLEFRLPDAVAPSALGLSEDTRLLGMAVREMAIRAVD